MTEAAKRRRAEYQRNWRAANPDRAKAIAKRSRTKNAATVKARHHNNYSNNKDRQRGYNLRIRYGITQAQYDALLSQQEYRCAICRTDAPGGKGSWHIDHCHTTQAVRGLLCHPCNTGLGLFKDSHATLLRAADYLVERT